MNLPDFFSDGEGKYLTLIKLIFSKVLLEKKKNRTIKSVTALEKEFMEGFIYEKAIKKT